MIGRQAFFIKGHTVCPRKCNSYSQKLVKPFSFLDLHIVKCMPYCHSSVFPFQLCVALYINLYLALAVKFRRPLRWTQVSPTNLLHENLIFKAHTIMYAYVLCVSLSSNAIRNLSHVCDTISPSD